MVDAATLLLENIPQKIITFQIERITTPEGTPLTVKLRTPRADEYGDAVSHVINGTLGEHVLEIYARLVANCMIEPSLREVNLNDAIAGYKGGLADPYLIVNTIFTASEVMAMARTVMQDYGLEEFSGEKLKKKAKN